jgi:hypothetical protein
MYICGSQIVLAKLHFLVLSLLHGVLARWGEYGRPREVGYMERPIEPNMGPSLADVLLCTFESMY